MLKFLKKFAVKPFNKKYNFSQISCTNNFVIDYSDESDKCEDFRLNQRGAEQ